MGLRDVIENCFNSKDQRDQYGRKSIIRYNDAHDERLKIE
jgi:hypothetical protein